MFSVLCSFLNHDYINAALDRYKFKNVEEMYASVGFGAISQVKIISRMLDGFICFLLLVNSSIFCSIFSSLWAFLYSSNTGVVVKGIDNCLVKLSKCCNPVPGDNIIGYITKGRGVSVHRTDCVNVKDLLKEEDRIIDVYWYTEETAAYNVDITVFANDRAGLLAEVIQVLGNVKTKLIALNSKTTKEHIATIEITIEVENIEELNKVLKELRKIDSVYEVARKK